LKYLFLRGSAALGDPGRNLAPCSGIGWAHWRGTRWDRLRRSRGGSTARRRCRL